VYLKKESTSPNVIWLFVSTKYVPIATTSRQRVKIHLFISFFRFKS
jgi:hypothetical protein